MVMSAERQGRATVAHQCPSCGERYPASYRVCPKDGTTLDRALHQRQLDDPLIGSVLGGTYRVLRPLTNGGMARLYQAEHVRLSTRVVAKLNHAELLSGSADAARSAAQRLEREAEALVNVRSPHVVRILDRCKTADGRLALILEWLDGEDLAVRLRRVKVLPAEHAVAIGRQLASALIAAHRASVLHRDIKPSNVFLERNGHPMEWVKLLDFGVAKLSLAEDPITRDGALLGTPAYMAPEQARGAQAVDERTDIYGLCAVMYHMLSGQSPTPMLDPKAQLAWLQESGTATPLKTYCPDLHPELASLVESGIARLPEARPQSAQAVANSLEHIAARLSPPQEPGSPGLARTSPVRTATRTRKKPKSALPRIQVSALPFWAALLAATLTHGLSDGAVNLTRFVAVAVFGTAAYGLWRVAKRHPGQPLGAPQSVQHALRGFVWSAIALATGAILWLFFAAWMGHSLLPATGFGWLSGLGIATFLAGFLWAGMSGAAPTSNRKRIGFRHQEAS